MNDNDVSEYIQLAQHALEILNMPFRLNDSLNGLLQRLEEVLPLPASSTELSIRNLSQELSQAIIEQREREEILSLLKQLRQEVSFLTWD